MKAICKYTILPIVLLLVTNVGSNARQTAKSEQFTAPSKQELFWFVLRGEESGNTNIYKYQLYKELLSLANALKAQNTADALSPKMLRNVYKTTTRKVLSEFVHFSTLADLLERKAYNCVSATLLYAFLLEEVGMPYTIYATHTHTYIIVHTSKGDVLLEPTALRGGILTNASRIARQIEAYNAESQQVGIALSDSISTENRSISLNQLAGLHFYNLFLKHYQAKEYEMAARAFKKALFLYQDAPEIRLFTKLFAQR